MAEGTAVPMLGCRRFKVGRGHGDPPAEARGEADVFQLGRLGRIGVQSPGDRLALDRVEVVGRFRRPDGGRFHDQGLAIGIERIAHDFLSAGIEVDATARATAVSAVPQLTRFAQPQHG